MRLLQGLLLFFAAATVQWFWSTYLPVFGLAPQLLLILTLAVGGQAGAVAGQCFGFAWGLFLDVLSAHVFGANALAFTLAGYVSGMLRRQMDVSSPLSQAMLVAVVTPVYLIFLGLVGLAFEHSFLWAGWRHLFVGPLYNGLVAPFAFALARRYAPS